jgi:hypothetical protein
MITITIFLSLVLFLTGILFFPLKVVVNTQQKEYYISLPGYFRADLLFANPMSFKLRLRIFFFSFRIEPGKRVAELTESSEGSIPIKSKRNRRSKNMLDYIRRMITCFRINRLQADIDTGNYPLNAQLIPIAQRISHNNIDLRINFENYNRVDFYATTRMHKLVYAFLKYKFTTK